MNKTEFIKFAFFSGIGNITDPLGIPMKFEPVAGSRLPAGVSRKHIFYMWQVAAHYGFFPPIEEILQGRKIIHFQFNKVLIILTSQALSIMEARDRIIFGLDGIWSFELQNGLSVMSELNAMQIDSWLYSLNEMATQKGWMDGKGRKMLFNHNIPIIDTTAIKVSDYFGTYTMLGPFPVDYEEKDILAKFDQPELLRVVTTDIAKFICEKNNGITIAFLEQIVKTLRGKGIITFEQLLSLNLHTLKKEDL